MYINPVGEGGRYKGMACGIKIRETSSAEHRKCYCSSSFVVVINYYCDRSLWWWWWWWWEWDLISSASFVLPLLPCNSSLTHWDNDYGREETLGFPCLSDLGNPIHNEIIVNRRDMKFDQGFFSSFLLLKWKPTKDTCDANRDLSSVFMTCNIWLFLTLFDCHMHAPPTLASSTFLLFPQIIITPCLHSLP